MDQRLQLRHCKITKLPRSNIQCTTYGGLEAQRNAPTLCQHRNDLITLIPIPQKSDIAELTLEMDTVGVVLERKC